MTVWNYRIIYTNELFAIHEVYYNEDGSVYAWSNPVKIDGDTIEDCKWAYKTMSEAFGKPILEPSGETLVEYKEV